MTKEEFFIKSLNEELVLKLKWYKSVFALPMSDDLTVKIEGNHFTYNGENIEGNVDKPLLDLYTIMSVPKNMFTIRKESFKDTIGNILFNYIIMEKGLNGKGVYKQDMSNKEELVKYLLDGLTEEKFTSGDIIKTVNGFKFIRSLSKILVIPQTAKTYDPPKWLDSEKKRLVTQYEKQYGKEWIKDKALITKFENEIMDKVKGYYKDDPTYGITLDKKAFKSFKKKFVMIGNNESITKDKDTPAVLNSLEEEYPDSKDEIAAIFNSVIYGSGSRALATIDAGVIVKRLLTAVHSFKIDIDDCKTTDGYDITVEEDRVDILKQFYVIVNGKSIPLTVEYLKKNINKTITIRNIAFCKARGDHLCTKCTGKFASMNENGIVLLTSKVGGDGLNFNLSKFHGSDYSIIEFKLSDITGI